MHGCLNLNFCPIYTIKLRFSDNGNTVDWCKLNTCNCSFCLNFSYMYMFQTFPCQMKYYKDTVVQEIMHNYKNYFLRCTLVMIVTDLTSHTMMMRMAMKEITATTMATIPIDLHLEDSKERWSRNTGTQNKL